MDLVESRETNAIAERNLRRAYLEVLHAIAQASVKAAGLDNLLELVIGIFHDMLYPEDVGIAFLDEEIGAIRVHPTVYTRSGLKFPPLPVHRGVMGAVLRSGTALRIGDVQAYPDYICIDERIHSELCVPLAVRERLVGVINVESCRPDAFSEVDEVYLSAVSAELGIAIERVRLIESERNHRDELKALVSVSSIMRTAQNQVEMIPPLFNHIIDLYEAEGVAIALRSRRNFDMLIENACGKWQAATGLLIPLGMGIAEVVLNSKQTYFCENTRTDPNLYRADLFHKVECLLCLPLIAEDYVIGLVYIGRSRPFSAYDVQLGEAIADMAANGFNRARSNEETRYHLRRVNALRAIDQTILSSQDLRVTLDILVKDIIPQLEIDAANIMLYDAANDTLAVSATFGICPRYYNNLTLALGESHAGQVAQSRKMKLIPDLRESGEEMTDRLQEISQEFIGFAALPLVAKGEIKGVLQLFHRARLEPDPDWIDFLKALADQSAIAIYNAQLFEQQEKANLNLVLAYDDTIEGWSRALDLRDRETEGHSQRVTELTLKLAPRVGIPETELAQVRRGAQLHDIGKMGIPDNILLKPGPLSQGESEIMRRHPQYARDLLSPIEYLRPAIEIPYCHHEKWDGSGYPNGLKAEEIPLAARVFAVVDVWDALTSDRPYRPAWSEEVALEYIQQQSGRHFDPAVVEAFLKLSPEERKCLDSGAR